MMKRALVFSEHGITPIKKVTLGILQRLTTLNIPQVEVAFIGTPEQADLNLLSQFNIKQIHLIKGPSLKYYNAETYGFALHSFLKRNHFDMVFSGTSSKTLDIFPRLSILFNSGLANSVTDFYLNSGKIFGVKEIYGGQYLIDIEITGSKPWFMTIKPDPFRSKNRDQDYKLDIKEFFVPELTINSNLVETQINDNKRPPLDEADIVVAGGRGLGHKSNMKILEKLADALGAALGASGGAIGNDFAPKEYLVGQTGAKISPLLYISCGISGAIQHLAGIRNAKYILAINTDINAPLMRIADYAIVGKINEIIPAITKQLITIKKQ